VNRIHCKCCLILERLDLKIGPLPAGNGRRSAGGFSSNTNSSCSLSNACLLHYFR
jgi:hypothetical protein